MTELAAVVGMGQTKHSSKNGDVSIAGLVRESAEKALIDANLDWNDIDAVILGKAPDMFEGVMMPELYLSDALVANNKPILSCGARVVIETHSEVLVDGKKI